MSDGLVTFLAITRNGVATILALVWRDSEKQNLVEEHTISKTGTRHLPNTSLKSHHFI